MLAITRPSYGSLCSDSHLSRLCSVGTLSLHTSLRIFLTFFLSLIYYVSFVLFLLYFYDLLGVFLLPSLCCFDYGYLFFTFFVLY